MDGSLKNLDDLVNFQLAPFDEKLWEIRNFPSILLSFREPDFPNSFVFKNFTNLR
jgi:hypothetical protein